MKIIISLNRKRANVALAPDEAVDLAAPHPVSLPASSIARVVTLPLTAMDTCDPYGRIFDPA